MIPRVTAICVVDPRRPAHLLATSLECFRRQTVDDKQITLVVQTTAHGRYCWRIAKKVGLPNEWIRILVIGKERFDPLSAWLTAAWRSRGEYVAVWDDDDQCGDRRLSEQMQLKTASVRVSAIYAYYDSQELYIGEFSQPGGYLHERCTPSSLVIPRERLPNLGAVWGSGLKCPSAALLEGLALSGGVEEVRADATDFLVGVHAHNMRGQDLHRRLGSRSPGIYTREEVTTIEDDIQNALEQYRLTPGEWTLNGRDGAVSTWEIRS